MDLLPYELIRVIISHLDVLDIFTFCKVSKKFNAIKYDKSLWKKKMKKEFPNVSKVYSRYDSTGKEFLKTREKKKIYYDSKMELCVRLTNYKKQKLQELVEKNKEWLKNNKELHGPKSNTISLINVNNLPICYDVCWGHILYISSEIDIGYDGVFGVVNNKYIKINLEDNLSQELIDKYTEEYISKGYIIINPSIMNTICIKDMEFLGIFKYL